MKEIQEVIAEILSDMDPEAALLFAEKFHQKLEELKNEQTNLQEDPGAPR